MRRRNNSGERPVTSSPSDPDRAGIGDDQTVDHPQRRRLAAARGAEQHAKLARRHRRATDRIDDRAAVIALGDVVELDHRGVAPPQQQAETMLQHEIGGERQTRSPARRRAARDRARIGRAPRTRRCRARRRRSAPRPPRARSSARSTMRSPASNTGSANGNSTRQKICRGGQPHRLGPRRSPPDRRRRARSRCCARSAAARRAPAR